MRVRAGLASCTALLVLVGATAPPGLAPQQAIEPSEARALDSALQRYRTLAAGGGWVLLPAGPALRRGDSGRRVNALRERLAREGYLDASDSIGGRFDDRLARAVARFQEHHGLAGDSIAGAATRAALNVTASARAGQIARNLRWIRAQPARDSARHIRINIPAFELEIVEGGRAVMTLRVIVGRRDWPTPVTHSSLSALIFRPVWRVPPSIAIREIDPLVARDPGYPARNGMRVIASGSVTRYVQEPGPANPLGGVKFPLETPYGVHLHDTPSRGLFERPRRALSHGCVRVEHADRLAQYLLPGWSQDSIVAAMSSGRDRRVALEEPIPVYLDYRTAWVTPDGLVAFRVDIYQRE